MRVWQRVPWRLATSYPKLRYLTDHSRTMDVAAATSGELFLERRHFGAPGGLGGHAELLRSAAHASAPGPDVSTRTRTSSFAHPVVILGEDVWRKRSTSRPEIVGQSVRLGGRTFSVVGVMPARLRKSWGWSLATDAWIPAMMAPLGMRAKEWRETPAAIELASATIWSERDACAPVTTSRRRGRRPPFSAAR